MMLFDRLLYTYEKQKESRDLKRFLLFVFKRNTCKY